MYSVDEAGGMMGASLIVGIFIGFLIFFEPVKEEPTIYNKVMRLVETYPVSKCETTYNILPDICIKNLQFNLSHNGEFKNIEFSYNSNIYMANSTELVDIRGHFSEDQLNNIAEVLQERMDKFNKKKLEANKAEVLRYL